MNLKSWRALGGSLILCVALSACSGFKSKASARKPAAPTPAERLALKHYKLGIDSYANDHYAEAISHWKITLEKDPKNTNAAEYITRAENMLKVAGDEKKTKN